MTDSIAGLGKIDVSDPQNPMELDPTSTLGSAQKVYISGGYAYIADAHAGLQIVD